jgi:membrane protein
LERPQEPLYKRIFSFLKAAADEFGQDFAGRFAAALSFYTLFSLVPLLFLVVAVVGYVSADSVLVTDDCTGVSAASIPESSQNPLDKAISQVEAVAGTEIADQLAQLTCQANASRTSFLWIGIGLAAFSGSAIFLHLQGVLNWIFEAPTDRVIGIGNALLSRGIALGWALVLAVLVLAPVLAVGGVGFISSMVTADWLRRILSIAVPLTSLLLLIGVVAATFQFLTRADVSGKAARRGGLATALAALLGAYLVGFYLSRFGAGGALGAIGGVAVLLFFFNLMWSIYLFGAELTKVYDDYLEHGDIRAPSHRARLAVAASRPEEGPPATSPLRHGIMAFLIGLVTGWVARRKD